MMASGAGDRSGTVVEVTDIDRRHRITITYCVP